MKKLIVALLFFSSSAVFAQGQWQGGGGGGGGMAERPSPEQRAKYEVKWMTKKCELSDEQADKVKVISLKYAEMAEKNFEKMAAGGFPPSESARTEMRQTMMEMRTNKENELSQVLSADQMEKYKAQVAKEMEAMRMGGGRPGN